MATKTTVLAETIHDNIDIQFDEFLNEIFIKKDVAGQEVLIEAGRLTDSKVFLIQAFLERKYDMSLTQSKLYDAISMTASQHVFSSVYDWIESKSWDGEKRLWDIGSKVFGVDDPAVNRAIGIWIINLVGGAYGVDTGKFQYTLDIIGNQGTGKTSFLKRLGDIYYTDQFMSFTKKDDFEIMMKNLIVNDDEMQVTEFSKDKIFKKFVSTSEFSYRPAYGRNNITKKRHFVIARTTNDSSYLTDIGGNRRIIPVILNDAKIKTPAYELTDDWYENVLGEAKEYYIDHAIDTIDDINQEMNTISFAKVTDNLNIFAEVNDTIMNVLDTQYLGIEKIKVTDFVKDVENELYNNMIEYNPKLIKNQINMVMQREQYTKKLVKANGKTFRAYQK
ncbi:VapE domain-containing protein [Leuconostoc mesenteroides]|uniref:VapE domain-containing protein n=1 Tax=Leuconostoc mesenteroides TaxID=1245 RepID=UPI000B9D7FDE|nr:VapE domain-containing protein [Leuconostoc mesenteroides]BAX73132.1 prophage protein, contains VRR-NUC domain [Leuconostoc mesenteroides]